MNLQELQQRLISSNIPADAYSLSGGLPSEVYCIEQNSDGLWYTYYSERGLRTGERAFKTESEACEDLFAQIADQFD